MYTVVLFYDLWLTTFAAVKDIGVKNIRVWQCVAQTRTKPLGPGHIARHEKREEPQGPQKSGTIGGQEPRLGS